MIEGKKISELIPANVVNDACCFPILSKGATRKITFAVLLENIISNLQFPETQEIKKLKEDVEQMNVSVELTDKQVQSVINQVNGLQKDVDSQDEIIVKYIKLFDELKDAYNRIEAEGMIIDGELDVDSEHAISNKAVAQLIPEQANEENKLADKNFVNSSIQENINNFFIINNNYKTYVDSLPYAKIGVNTGSKAGYLRKYKKPKKICVIGNSITCHGFCEHDGISWTVGDYREMAASRPNSGWVALIQQYVTKHINPDCKIYKANGSVWERGTEGSRDYSLMANEQAYEVVDEGTQLIEEFTIDKMLTQDTDIVLIQLCENMQVNDVYATSLDFEKLFDSIRDKCPKAEIYAFLGFWAYKQKIYPIVSACSEKNVNTVFAPNLIKNVITDDLSIYKAQMGDVIYDLGGNQIATVSNAVSGHPNDFGFKVIATYFLDALFNNRSANVDGLRLIYTCEDVENPKKTEISYIKKGIHGDIQFQNAYGELFECFILCGKYETALTYPLNQISHGYLQIDCSGNRKTAYNACRQRFIPLNDNVWNVREVYRNVVLSDNFTTFGDMRCVYHSHDFDIDRKVYEQYINIPNETFLTNTNWTSIGVWDKKPKYILNAYYIIPADIGVAVDFDKKVLSPRILCGYDSIQIASNHEGETTLPSGTILYIKYAY